MSQVVLIHPQKKSLLDSHTFLRTRSQVGVQTSLLYTPVFFTIVADYFGKSPGFCQRCLSLQSFISHLAHDYACCLLVASLHSVYAVSPLTIGPMTTQLIDLQVHRLKSWCTISSLLVVQAHCRLLGGLLVPGLHCQSWKCGVPL